MGQRLTKRIEALIRSLSRHHGRKKHRFCLCEGVRCCRELLTCHPELVRHVVCSETFDLSSLSLTEQETIVASEREFRDLSATKQPQGVLIVAMLPDTAPHAEPLDDSLLVVFDRVSDPGNFGTICRTVKAVGLKEIWMTEGGCDPYNEKAIRSGMGSQFSLEFRIFPDLECLVKELRTIGRRLIFRTDPHQGIDCFSKDIDYRGAVVVFGSEAHGAESIDGTTPLTINMPGDSESLNVAQAATVILFDYLRRHAEVSARRPDRAGN